MANTDKVRVMLRRFSIILYRMDQQHNTFITTRPIFKTTQCWYPKTLLKKGRAKTNGISWLIYCWSVNWKPKRRNLDGARRRQHLLLENSKYQSLALHRRWCPYCYILSHPHWSPLSGRFFFPPECVFPPLMVSSASSIIPMFADSDSESVSLWSPSLNESINTLSTADSKQSVERQ